ncbi:TRNA (guanine(26)-N(2))-dimethyltransferase [Aphelenchoides bicaudatus]|nr:TRNA (guanine(26)-N(2))-dimethyltransferase [Aphelenchoides bicaudatus]
MSTEITEGLAKIRFNGSAEVFYNPAQEFNRDLTISVLRQLGKEREAKNFGLEQEHNESGDEPALKRRRREPSAGFQVLDALSASGLRALRFAKEVPGLTRVVANDFSEGAVEIIKNNVEVNGVKDLVTVTYSDATQLMSEHRILQKRFHAVDLDPYGSASPFLNTAVQCVADRGILMVTCTDMACLCGNTPEAAMSKYGSTTFRHKSCHEAAIRILLRSVQQHAAMYDRYIEPLVCVSVDFYIRCFIRMHTGAQKAKDGSTRLSNVLYCTGCHGLGFQPLVNKVVNGNSIKFNIARYTSNGLADERGLCVHCKGSVQMAGPIYTGNYFNREFVTQLLEDIVNTPEGKRLGTHERLVGLLSVMLEELDDVPLYYEIDQLVQVCKQTVPTSQLFRSAFLNAGYQCSSSHCTPKALKTDAPLEFIWDVVRTLAANNQKGAKQLKEQSPGHKILKIAPKHTIDFTFNPNSIYKSRLQGLLRYQSNRGRNHGPGTKAKGSVNSAKAATYQAINQEENDE